MNIPIEYQNFCREVGKLARKYKLSSFCGNFSPPIHEMGKINRIDFSWDSGRHNADTGNISIHADTWINTTIDEGE